MKVLNILIYIVITACCANSFASTQDITPDFIFKNLTIEHIKETFNSGICSSGIVDCLEDGNSYWISFEDNVTLTIQFYNSPNSMRDIWLTIEHFSFQQENKNQFRDAYNDILHFISLNFLSYIKPKYFSW